MNRRILIGLSFALAIPALLVPQSLTELAKEEKERRKKNKERGEQVQVITDKELAENTGTIANPDAQTTSTPATAAAETRRPSSTTSGNSTSEDDTSAEDEVPKDVAADAAIAFYHVGVEEGWYEGLAACAAGGGTPATVDALRAQLLDAPPPPRCDEVAWSLFGVSMAGYNMMYAASLAGFSLAAAAVLARRAKT